MEDRGPPCTLLAFIRWRITWYSLAMPLCHACRGGRGRTLIEWRRRSWGSGRSRCPLGAPVDLVVYRQWRQLLLGSSLVEYRSVLLAPLPFGDQLQRATP